MFDSLLVALATALSVLIFLMIFNLIGKKESSSNVIICVLMELLCCLLVFVIATVNGGVV